MGWASALMGAGMKGVFGVGKSALSTAWSGGYAKRAAWGMGVGGVAAGATSPYDSGDLTLGRIGEGMFAGAVFGAATGIPRSIGRGMKGKAIGHMERQNMWKWGQDAEGNPVKQYFWGQYARQSLKGKAGTIGDTIKGGYQAGLKYGGGALKFAANHPFLAAGAAIGTVGAYSALNAPMRHSPTERGADMSPNYDRQMMAAQRMLQSHYSTPFNPPMMGPAPVMMGPMKSAFQDSTVGLTQGLHNGRHS